MLIMTVNTDIFPFFSCHDSFEYQISLLKLQKNLNRLIDIFVLKEWLLYAQLIVLEKANYPESKKACTYITSTSLLIFDPKGI